MKVRQLFHLESAKSKANDDYDHGEIPYVSSTTLNNGVLKFVDPFPDDKVFSGGTICVSGLGYATVQTRNYLPKGNGGDSCTILTPHETMSLGELVFYAAVFNETHTWRLSFGRKANKSRIEELELPKFSSYQGGFKNRVERQADLFLASLNHLKSKIDLKISP